MGNLMTKRIELKQGTLDVLILKSLSWEPLHGYSISRWIKDRTDSVLNVEEGALYPGLHRLERRGWIESDWGLSENNRRAKYYQLTTDGKAALSDQAAEWGRYVEAVSKVLVAEELGRP
jgi:PadR family transcriptional regulator PadR